MSKTFKLGGIMLTTIVSLQIVRLFFGYINLSDNVSSWLFSFIMQCLCLGVVPYVMYRVLISDSGKEFVKDVRLEHRIAPVSYLLAVLIGLLAYVVNIGASTVSYTVLNLLGYTYIMGGGTIYSGSEVLIMDIITTAMFPAFFEELTNRGILMAALDNEKSDKVKIIFMGFFFGAFHQNIPQFFPTVIIGLVIAYMAVKTQSIIPGMIVHFLNNFIIILSSYGSQKGNALGAVFDLIDGILYSNVIILAGAVALAAWLIVILLKRLAFVNAKQREARDPVVIRDVPDKEDKSDIKVRIMDIYGFSVHNADTDGNRTEDADARVRTECAETTGRGGKSRVNVRDNILLVTAFVSAMIVTVFTFIWGILR